MDKNELFEYVFSKHSKQLQNLNHKNDQKLIIAFSGVPGSGKTTLATKIEAYFNAIRINNDDIRSIISEKLKLSATDPQVHRLIKEYIIYLVTKIAENPNKLIILDSSIDRTFDTIQNLAKENDYKVYVIKLISNKEEIVERIKNRNGEDAKFYLQELDRQIEDFKRFNQLHEADFVYQQDDKKLFWFLNGLIKSG